MRLQLRNPSTDRRLTVKGRETTSRRDRLPPLAWDRVPAGGWLSHSGLVVLLLAFALVACDRPAPVTPAPAPTRTPPPSPAGHATLQVVKFVDKTQASAGDVLQYSLVVINGMLAGADPGTTVAVVDALPAELHLLEDTLSSQGSYEADTRTIRWSGAVPRGGSFEVRFQARLTDAAANMRSVINTVQVTDAFGQQRQASAQTQMVPPTATNTPVPSPLVTPTVAETNTPVLPTATLPRPSATPHPSPTPTILQEPESLVPFVYGLIVTPDEPPLYYLVVDRALYRSTDRGNTWSRESLAGVPDAAAVYVAAVDYRHPQTMYLGTDQGLYRREQPDEPWELVNTLVVSALAVDLENPDVLWAGTRWGTELFSVLVKSEDRGRTWGKADHGIERGYVSVILVNPNNPNILWAHVRPSRRGSWPAGLIYRGGRAGTWERLSLGQFDDLTGGLQNPEACSASGLSYDPNLNALYVGCDITYFYSVHRSYRLLRSLNADSPNSAEVKWELLADLGAASDDFVGVNSVRPLAVDAREPKSLFVFLDVTHEIGQPRFKLLVSYDDGKTWEELSLRGLPGE